MMAAPKPPYRRAPVDHVAEVLMHLEAAEAALGRIDDGRLSTDGRTAVATLRTAVLDGRLSCAQAMEVLLGGRLVAPQATPIRRGPKKVEIRKNVPPVPVRFQQYSVADFTVGQWVTVNADQGYRPGVVTKLGRTRVTVIHPRNRRGDMVERAYPMGAIIVGQAHVGAYWNLVVADGDHWPMGDQFQPHPDLPRVDPLKEGS